MSWGSFGKTLVILVNNTGRPFLKDSLGRGLPAVQGSGQAPGPSTDSEGGPWHRPSWGRGEEVGRNTPGTLADPVKAAAQDPGDRAACTIVGTRVQMLW